MQKVLTAAQMREVDRRTTEEYGIPSVILMENAAHAVARVITEKLGGSVKGKSILILCGPGNNGGDGAALGRVLALAGADVTVVLIGTIDETKGDARVNFEYLRNFSRNAYRLREDRFMSFESLKIRFLEHTDGEYFRKRFHSDNPPVVVVDALFGTGLTRPLAGAFEQVLGSQWLEKASDRENPFVLLSIDLPSGLNADSSIPVEPFVESDITVTFTAAKIANVVPPAAGSNGELIVANIGSPQHLVNEQGSDLYFADAELVTHWLVQAAFDNGSYKNKRGHALLIAGSKNYTGAAVLAGDAGIRSGVGLVTLAVPESSRESVVARVVPEVMVRGIAETSEGSAAESAADEIKSFLKNVDAIAIGSGMSTNEETAAFVRRMVDERTMPMVVDADGLTALSPAAEKLQKPAPKQGRNTQRDQDQPALILTPHEGEFCKLLGLSKEEADEILKDRVAAVRYFATKHNVVLVLKGERVLIGAPDGRVIVNPTGNSGLGKAGNGDTLTGILIGFVAQAVQMKIDMVHTVVAACYVAGMAGDVAEKKYGKRVMTASDVRECLVDVFNTLEAS